MKRKTPTLGQQRLAKLAKYLYSVPARKFSMSEWQSGDRLSNCGSTACAIGHAAVLFKKEGFHLSRLNKIDALRPYYEEKTNWIAVEAFFDLRDYEEAKSLFGPELRLGPRGVAKRIKLHLKENNA